MPTVEEQTKQDETEIKEQSIKGTTTKYALSINKRIRKHN